jgi:hypothetical protein
LSITFLVRRRTAAGRQHPSPGVSPQAVFDELCAILDGGDSKKTELKKGKTNIVMFVGLQGAPRQLVVLLCLRLCPEGPAVIAPLAWSSCERLLL